MNTNLAAATAAVLLIATVSCGACGEAPTEHFYNSGAIVEVATSSCGWQWNRCERECAGICAWDAACRETCEADAGCRAMGHAPEERVCVPKR